MTRVKVLDPKVHVTSKAPESAIMNQLFGITYKIVNLTQDKLNLKLTLSSCPYIYLTGDTEISLKLDPQSSVEHEVKALPAKIGLYELPTIKLVSKIANTGKEELINASQQYYILVKPELPNAQAGKVQPDIDLY